jgi:hypothetical protein
MIGGRVTLQIPSQLPFVLKPRYEEGRTGYYSGRKQQSDVTEREEV